MQTQSDAAVTQAGNQKTANDAATDDGASAQNPDEETPPDTPEDVVIVSLGEGEGGALGTMPILDATGSEDLLAEDGYCTTLDLGICFAAGTPVLMADGTTRPIETLRPGDQVLSAPEHNAEASPTAKTVQRVFHNPPSALVILTIGGTTLRSTPPHLFYVRHKGWTAAADLQVGDQLRTPDARWTTLDAKEAQSTPEPVFNFRVADYHTYFVGDPAGAEAVLVHNEYDGEEEWTLSDYLSAEKNGINDFFEDLGRGFWNWCWSGDNKTVRELYLEERTSRIPTRADLIQGPFGPQFSEAGEANRGYLESCERRRLRDLERLSKDQIAREQQIVGTRQDNANKCVTPHGRDSVRSSCLCCFSIASRMDFPSCAAKMVIDGR